MAAASGYSGTPLAKKLSLKDGLRVCFIGMPASVRAEIDAAGLALVEADDAPLDAVHLFVTERVVLVAELARLRPLLRPSGFIWISWPKKASKVPTDITEDVIRDVIGSGDTGGDLVDVKVCAVDAVWSGLKLMIRKDRR